MLVIISDLHFVDETAGKHNLSTKAYESFLGDLNVAKRMEEGRVREVTLLLLGDVFNILRSHHWFEDTLGDKSIRPWGSVCDAPAPDGDAARDKSLAILRDILSKDRVRDTCACIREWKAGLEDRFGPGTARVVLVPGNHDRYLHTDGRARSAVRAALSLEGDGEEPLAVRHVDREHRVLAYHGHEMDLLNFGRGPWQKNTYAAEAYGLPSIGEVITVDLVSHIPWAAHTTLPDFDRKAALVHALKNMDNIRPVAAVFEYLDELLAGEPADQRTALDALVAEAFRCAGTMKFVREWSEKADQDWIPGSVPWYARLGARLLDRDFHEYLAGVKSIHDAKNMLSSASRDVGREGERFKDLWEHPFVENELKPSILELTQTGPCYLVYGHTHHPEILAASSRPRTVRAVVNTGTFRPRVDRCLMKGEGFLTHKAMSYVVFYRDDEEVGQDKQYYEMWMGSLAEH